MLNKSKIYLCRGNPYRVSFTACRNSSVEPTDLVFSSTFDSVIFLFVELIETDFRVCFFLGGCAKTEEEEAASSEEDSSSFRGSGVCKWFNVRMGFGFLSMTHREGICLDSPVDVFVHQVREREREHAVVFNGPDLCKAVSIISLLYFLMAQTT